MRIQKPADLARIVKTRRQSQGLTQQEVADAAGITRQSLARIEHGQAGASFDLVLRIFEKLGVSLEATLAGPAVTDDPGNQEDADLNRTAIDKALTRVRVTNSPAQSSSWQSVLEAQIARIRDDAAKNNVQLSEEEARKALLDAAIQAGDPDLHVSNISSAVSSGGERNG